MTHIPFPCCSDTDASVVEDEFIGVEQSPEQVRQRLLQITLLFESGLNSFQFCRGRFTTQAPHVKFPNDSQRIIVLLHQTFNQLSFYNLSGRRFPVQQVQCLRQCRGRFDFA